ncbi:MAG: hypothetical protein J7604_00555 [Sporocytophaga sp.]|uniref:hypothetical protein n=1 Tax=Sporocytophaga sp. TaxID=2231183 RepID=UPI001B12273A|nr:hypothetical protein [Sporocytophaga sp.]MBO9698660.1 hypothetical protein [Sporocytophaga sp.]
MNKSVVVCALLSFITFSCQNSVKEAKLEKPAGDSIIVKTPWKKPSGTPDLPLSDSMITSAGIGKIILGSKLDSVQSMYTLSESYLLWDQSPALKISLTDSYWIIAETSGSVGIINLLRTNSPDIKSKSGYHVGLSFSEIADSLIILRENKLIYFAREGVAARPREKDVKRIFGKSFNRNALMQSSIAELVITCEDC